MLLQKAIEAYLRRNNHTQIQLKTILFDMDGVLYDSMPGHAYAWHETMKEMGITSTPDEFYLYEGQTGRATISQLFLREKQRPSTTEENETIYARKTHHFTAFGKAPIMIGASEVLAMTKAQNLTPILVTGSGQASLIEKLQNNFPDTFHTNNMVTAYDVLHGKPHPEPYLKGLSKTGAKPFEAIVVENAPLGVRAASAAGIFTVAVNTGPLSKELLYQEGADIVFDSMLELSLAFDSLLTLLKKTRS